MWRISYLNLKNDDIEQKGGLASDKEADDWAMEQERNASKFQRIHKGIL